MNLDLGEDVNALREVMHRWPQDRVEPMSAEIDEANEFPEKLWEEMGALVLSEARAGSDVVGMKLTAKKKNDRFILNGNKIWITNGREANTFVFYAKTKTDPDLDSIGITAFLIEKSMPDFGQSRHLDRLSMRGSNTVKLVFEDCKVTYENILGEVGRGVQVLMSGLDYEWVVLSGIGTGIMGA